MSVGELVQVPGNPDAYRETATSVTIITLGYRAKCTETGCRNAASRPRPHIPLPADLSGEASARSDYLMSAAARPGRACWGAASSTASRHSRLTGRMGGIGATSGSVVGAAIEPMFSVCEPLRMKRL